jgi:glycosyltransferase involved in cell wall biosynthesis
MQLMTEEMRRRGFFATSATYSQEWFGHVNDIHLNLANESRIGKHLSTMSFFVWAAKNYDIFHFFWGSSLLSYRFGRHIDLPLLKMLGKKIFVHFRGIELVDIKYFDYLRARTAGEDIEEPPMSRPAQLKSAEVWRRYADRMLVSEPDLFRIVPEATLVQQAIDLRYWSDRGAPGPSSSSEGVVRICHAPSMRRKKGTEFVIDAVEGLKAEGLQVELVLIEDVPFHEVKNLYLSCDIGIDQVLYGWYGKVSIELMALGRPVVCYVDPELREFRPDMPIISGDPRNLKSTLRKLVRSPDQRAQSGRSGIEFVRRHHDVRSIVGQCLQIYDDVANS